MVPVPSQDRRRRPISKRRQRRVLKSLGSLFGSATALPSWGSWKEGPRDRPSIDSGQIAVLILTTSGKYRRHRPRLIRTLLRAGNDLDQLQMAVIAFRSAKGAILIRCHP